MREAPSWMLCVEPAVTLIRSSARGTDPYQELSSGWGLSGGEITSAVEPQPQHLKMGTKDSIPVSLLPFPPPALKLCSQLLLESLSQDRTQGLSAHYQDI